MSERSDGRFFDGQFKKPIKPFRLCKMLGIAPQTFYREVVLAEGIELRLDQGGRIAPDQVVGLKELIEDKRRAGILKSPRK